jgi:hypothetical protein
MARNAGVRGGLTATMGSGGSRRYGAASNLVGAVIVGLIGGLIIAQGSQRFGDYSYPSRESSHESSLRDPLASAFDEQAQPLVNCDAPTPSGSMKKVPRRVTGLASDYVDDDTRNEALVYDSSSATVLAMAVNYDALHYSRFVGTLRKSGYQGHVILATEPNIETAKPHLVRYLSQRNVTLVPVKYINCTSAFVLDPVDLKNSHLVERANHRMLMSR